jgi:hypothetical protein
MAQLFITPKDLKRYSVFSGNLDTDKFIQWIEVAQEIHIQNYLGTQLYEKIETLITTDALDANPTYKTLLETYIKPMTIHWSQVEMLPFLAYTVSNGGIYKHTSESSETVTKDEVDYLAEQERDIAQHYTRRFIDFMSFNQSTYPEYNSNSNNDMYPDKESNFTGWVISLATLFIINI